MPSIGNLRISEHTVIPIKNHGVSDTPRYYWDPRGGIIGFQTRDLLRAMQDHLGLCPTTTRKVETDKFLQEIKELGKTFMIIPPTNIIRIRPQFLILYYDWDSNKKISRSDVLRA